MKEMKGIMRKHSRIFEDDEDDEYENRAKMGRVIEKHYEDMISKASPDFSTAAQVYGVDMLEDGYAEVIIILDQWVNLNSFVQFFKAISPYTEQVQIGPGFKLHTMAVEFIHKPIRK